MQAPDSETLQREAFRWISRITSGDATEADRDAVLRWRAQSADHDRAFHDALRVWKSVGQAAGAKRRVGLSRRGLLTGGAVAAAACGVGVMGAQLGFWPGLRGAFADYATSAGEQRKFQLGANVGIELNTRSALSFDATQSLLTATLAEGEAAFTVAPGAAFRVSVADVLIGAEGGVFVVRHDGRDVRVTCLEKEIAILQPHAVKMRSLDQVVCNGGRVGPVARIENSETAAGWRQGLLSFRDASLETVVAELNRYRKGMIVIASRSVSERRVSGTFHLGRLDEALEHINQTLDVPLRHYSPYLTVLG